MGNKLDLKALAAAAGVSVQRIHYLVLRNRIPATYAGSSGGSPRTTPRAS
jgi:hypothetical protein